jgi:hypothetical protein
LKVEDLDFRAFADAKSNGEILLHVAGFEFLLIACARKARGETFDGSVWPSLKAGFAREAGFAPPTGRDLGAYFQLLTDIRRGTADYLARTCDPGIESAILSIQQVTKDLADADDENDEECYRRLAAGFSTSFRDDGSPDGQGMVDIPTLVALHETYHRGQITLNKYIRSRMRVAHRPGS